MSSIFLFGGYGHFFRLKLSRGTIIAAAIGQAMVHSIIRSQMHTKQSKSTLIFMNTTMEYITFREKRKTYFSKRTLTEFLQI